LDAQDANFNVTSIYGTSGTAEERFVYEPYGAFTTLDGSWSATTEGLSWAYFLQGRFLKVETGLYEFRRRLYGPALGTWSRRDPKFADWRNLYQFEAGAPISNVDPFGLSHLPPFVLGPELPEPTVSVTEPPDTQPAGPNPVTPPPCPPTQPSTCPSPPPFGPTLPFLFVTHVTLPAQVKREGQEKWTNVREGDILNSGDEIRTGPHGEIIFQGCDGKERKAHHLSNVTADAIAAGKTKPEDAGMQYGKVRTDIDAAGSELQSHQPPDGGFHSGVRG
jgi:RHS repeat-associated protein